MADIRVTLLLPVNIQKPLSTLIKTHTYSSTKGSPIIAELIPSLKTEQELRFLSNAIVVKERNEEASPLTSTRRQDAHSYHSNLTLH